MAICAQLQVKVDAEYTLKDSTRAYVFSISKENGTVVGFSQGTTGLGGMYGFFYTPPTK